MRESSEDFGEQDEDTEIQNLPLYTERKADGIYRYGTVRLTHLA